MNPKPLKGLNVGFRVTAQGGPLPMFVLWKLAPGCPKQNIECVALGFRVVGLGLRVLGLRFKVWGFGFRNLN